MAHVTLKNNTLWEMGLCNVPGHHKIHLQDKDISVDIHQRFKELYEEYGEASPSIMRTLAKENWTLVKMDIDSPPVSSRPNTLPLKYYEWVQKEIESLEWQVSEWSHNP